jgi:hypothetical protein
MDEGLLGEVRAAMHCRDQRGVCPTAGGGEGEIVDMRMENVEFIRMPHYFLGHGQVGSDGILAIGEPEGLSAAGYQAGGSAGISAGEEGDLVPHGYQGFGQVMDDALGAPIELRRNAFGKRRNLCYAHAGLSRCEARKPSL